MMQKKVSIVIPTFNRSAVIERSIKSVLAQSYDAFELIIVDDGSQDDTEKIVKNIPDERIRFVRQESNKGPSAARNLGVGESRYDYIAFQDSDDEWLPDKLKIQMEKMENSSENVGMVYSCYSGDGGIFFPKEWIPHNQRFGYIFPYLLRCNMIGTPTMLLKKQCFQQAGGFQEQIQSLEDWEFVLRFSKQYEIEYIDDVLVHIHKMPDSVNYQNSQILSAKLYILEQWKREILQYGLLEYYVDDLMMRATQEKREIEIASQIQKILDFEV